MILGEMAEAGGTASKMSQVPVQSTGGCFCEPHMGGFVWYLEQMGDGTEKQCVPATKGGKQWAENNMEERRYF